MPNPAETTNPRALAKSLLEEDGPLFDVDDVHAVARAYTEAADDLRNTEGVEQVLRQSLRATEAERDLAEQLCNQRLSHIGTLDKRLEDVPTAEAVEAVRDLIQRARSVVAKHDGKPLPEARVFTLADYIDDLDNGLLEAAEHWPAGWGEVPGGGG